MVFWDLNTGQLVRDFLSLFERQNNKLLIKESLMDLGLTMLKDRVDFNDQ